MTGASCLGTALQEDGAWPAACVESTLDQHGIPVCLVPSPLLQPSTPQAVGGQKPWGRVCGSALLARKMRFPQTLGHKPGPAGFAECCCEGISLPKAPGRAA